MGVFKKIKSLTESFTKATRRFAAVTTFGVSTIFATGTGFAQTQTVPANNNKTQTEQVSSTTKPLTEAQKKKINETLIQQGKDQAEGLMPSIEDSYSCWLESLQQDLNGQLAESNPDGDIRVVVLDPIQMDVGLALGLTAEKVAQLMLKANGIDADEELALDVADALTGYGYQSVAGDETYTQVPMMIPLEPDANGVQTRIIIPMSSYAPILDIPGMPLSDEVKMVATHEGWHAMDQQLDARFADINFDNLKVDSLQTIDQKIANIDYLKLSCAVYNSESYADIGAAGDLIRAGEPLETIDQIIAFRTENGRDPGHMSPPSLLELKKQITAMGIDNFRALSDEAALEIYDNVINAIGLTPERLTLVYQYVQCAPTEREAFVLQHQDNPDFDIAFQYINCFVTSATIDVLEVPTGGFDFSMFIDMMHASEEIQAWDALTELQKRAISIDGKITPVSYAKAYGSLMSELNTPLPEDATVFDQMMFEGKIIKLKNTFFEAVAGTDYVQANKDYGVDIVATDPALQKIAAEKDKKPVNNNKKDEKSDKISDKKKTFYYPG